MVAKYAEGMFAQLQYCDGLIVGAAVSKLHDTEEWYVGYAMEEGAVVYPQRLEVLVWVEKIALVAKLQSHQVLGQ